MSSCRLPLWGGMRLGPGKQVSGSLNSLRYYFLYTFLGTIAAQDMSMQVASGATDW